MVSPDAPIDIRTMMAMRDKRPFAPILEKAAAGEKSSEWTGELAAVDRQSPLYTIYRHSYH